MPTTPVIANNTPLVALWSLDRLWLLRELYGEILIPQSVAEEFCATEQTLREHALKQSSWIRPTPLADPRQALVYIGLDRGEADVLALAQERSARLVIMDERRGRRYAKRLGLPVTGTVGILLAAKERGLVTAITPLLETLVQEGLYLTPDIIAKARELAQE